MPTLRSSLLRLVLLCAACAALSACASNPGPTPTATRTPAPPATATPVPTDTPAASATPVATDTPSASPTPQPTALDINPLTGLRVSDPSMLEQRPLSIKISNAPGVNVRPQSGINSAEVVFEHIAEYGVTRLTGVFYAETVERVGSVRSCRILDKEIMRMFQTALACSGLSNGNYATFREMPEFQEGRILSPSYGDGADLFYRLDLGQPIPHNMYTDTPAIHAELDARTINQRPVIHGWAFDETVPTGGTPALQVNVNYKSLDSRAEWQYDAASGRWLRWESKQVFSDRLTGEQTSAANVLVVYAAHIETDIIEDDNGGALSIEIQLWGEGDILIYRDGQVYSGRWHRPDPQALFQITDMDGHVLPLKPGNTWVQVVTIDAYGKTTHADGQWVIDSSVMP